jgi:hypothetical protein
VLAFEDGDHRIGSKSLDVSVPKGWSQETDLSSE